MIAWSLVTTSLKKVDRIFVQEMKKNIILIEAIDSFSGMLVALWYSYLGWEIELLHMPRGTLPKLILKFFLKKVRFFDYSNFSKISFHNHVSKKNTYSELLYDALLVDRKLRLISKHFGLDATNSTSKIEVVLRDFLMRFLGNFDALSERREDLKSEHNQVFIAFTWNPIVGVLVSTLNIRSSIVWLFNFYVFDIKWLNFYHRLKNSLGGLEKRSVATEKNKGPEVLIFPHQGTSYGKSYKKNYYYSSDPASMFYHKRPIHLEYGNFSKIEKERLANNYISDEMRFGFLGKPSFVNILKWVMFPKNLFQILIVCQIRKEGFWCLLASFTLLGSVAAYTNYFFEKLRHYRNAKIAIAGYDVLLPKEIALAFEKLDVPLVAVQERYALLAAGNYNVLLDYYFTWGPGSKQIIELSNGKSYVGEYKVVGAPRLDFVHRQKPEGIHRHLDKMRSKESKKVTVFVGTPEPKEVDRLKLTSNWGNLKIVLEDMIYLAEKFDENQFTIRCKDNRWQEFCVFDELLDKLNRLGNIEINDEYSQFNISYKLLSDTDIVIGTHSSIIDESIILGLPVLIHDYGVNATKIFAENFNYENSPFFCHSRRDFTAKFEMWMCNDTYPADVHQTLKNKHFYMPNAQTVGFKIIKELNSIVQKT